MTDKTLKNIAAMAKAAPVRVLDAATLSESAFVGEYVSGSRPCVIRGAVRHWAAMQKWRDRNYLKSRAGHHPVYFHPHEYYVSARRMEEGRETLSFAEAVDRLHAPQTEIAIVATAATTELQGDLGRLPFLTRAEPAFSYPAARYFFYRNAGTTWHYHPFDETMLCQIVGTKQIGLLNADTQFHSQIHALFLKEDYYDDPSAFDVLGNVELPWFLATIEEGDALYIPPLWWHGVSPVGASFGASATVTWRSPLHVEAGIIRKLAAGEVHMIGGPDPAYLPYLRDIAHKTGLERELEVGWARQFTSGMI